MQTLRKKEKKKKKKKKSATRKGAVKEMRTETPRIGSGGACCTVSKVDDLTATHIIFCCFFLLWHLDAGIEHTLEPSEGEGRLNLA